MAPSRKAASGVWLALSAAGLAVVLAGCIDSKKLREAFDPCAGGACTPPLPQNCATLSSADWGVDGLLTTPETQVPQGGSYRTSLDPAVEAQCETTVVSVEWRADNPTVLSVLPVGRFAWVTGLALGTSQVGARITFADGVVRDARARTFRVVPPTGATGQVILEGELTIEPYAPPGDPARSWSGWVPFTTTTTGRIDVVVDWESPRDVIDFSGYEGHCRNVGSCGTLRLSLREHGVKPLHGTFDNPRTPPGAFTIRIDNLGPGRETVRYEIRLTPS